MIYGHDDDTATAIHQELEGEAVLRRIDELIGGSWYVLSGGRWIEALEYFRDHEINKVDVIERKELKSFFRMAVDEIEGFAYAAMVITYPALYEEDSIDDEPLGDVIEEDVVHDALILRKFRERKS